MDIDIKYHKDIIPLEYRDGSDWVDLRVAEDTVIRPGEFRLIPLGVSMKLPAGYEAHIVPRSSTYKNFGLIQTNHCGVVDENYCGDSDQWFFPALNLSDDYQELHRNDRICQFRVMLKQPKLNFNIVQTLKAKSRGGFGSTGVK